MERYEISQLIGEGSFGKVFVGRQRATGRMVALKQISKGGRLEKEIKSLQHECDIQQNLHHPNIIQMLDSYETDDAIVVVTELAHGDLQKVQVERRKQGLSGLNVQKIACDLVSALYFLHSHRILHRDIKPQNILIGIDGNAKLCDFGFAKTMGLNTYMLTSIKGTPLYMAPEIVQEKPYDHNADLWSLGCILYELLVGKPPFYTASLIELVWKIKKDEIFWDSRITGDCLFFLQGLLQKDPKKRLSWPALLTHPYVCGKLIIDSSVDEKALTKALSPSQELAKESERQSLQKRLEGYSKLMAKTAKKYEEAQQKLKRCSAEGRVGLHAPLPNANGVQIIRPTNTTKALKPSHARNRTVLGVPPQTSPKVSPTTNTKDLKVMFQNLKLQDRQNNTELVPRKLVHATLHNNENCEESTASSCETMSSSSESESDDADGENNTQSRGSLTKPNTRKDSSTETCISKGSQAVYVNIIACHSPEKSSSLGRSVPVLFTLYPRGSKDSPINTDEWLYFLMTTMKEVLDNPNSLCQKHFLNVVVPPLKNQYAESEVVEKIAALLSLPFTLDDSIHESAPGLISNLLTSYAETKVLPHLLFACKLIIINRAKGLSRTFEQIADLLTVADYEGLEKCLRLVTFLVHIDEEFVTQFCGCVCSLNVTGVLQLFLKVDGKRPGLAADTVAALCHLLRTFPKDKGIVDAVEEVLLHKNDSDVPTLEHNELWRLISHTNPSIQSRSIRVFTYMCLNSERVNIELEKQRPYVWKVLRRATLSPDADVRKTGEFALQALNFKSSYNVPGNPHSSGSRSPTEVALNPQQASGISPPIDAAEKKAKVVDASTKLMASDELLKAEFAKSSFRDSGSGSANDSSR